MIVHCARCGHFTAHPVPVHVDEVASGPPRTTYACPECAPTYPAQPDPLETLAAAQQARARRATS